MPAESCSPPARLPLLVAAVLSAALLSACTGASGSPRAAGPGTASPPGSAPASAAASPPPSPSPSPSPSVPPLPGGGTTIYPGRFVVLHYGTAGTAALGVLGQGTPAQAAARLARAAAPWQAASGRPVLRGFELITTVASSAAGPDGTYSTRVPDAQIDNYLAAARAAGDVLVLDLQPGRARFLDQARGLQRWLEQPDVGLALDPEWELQPGEQPARQVGHTTVAEVDAVSSWLAQLVAAHHLPQKLLVLHQFQVQSVRPSSQQLTPRAGLALVLHADGFGTPQEKRTTYAVVSLTPLHGLHDGFKLFYTQDTPLLPPASVMALRPRPELVSYQ